MTITATLDNGDEIDFEDGTPQEDIDSIIDSHMGSIKPKDDFSGPLLDNSDSRSSGNSLLDSLAKTKGVRALKATINDAENLPLVIGGGIDELANSRTLGALHPIENRIAKAIGGQQELDQLLADRQKANEAYHNAVPAAITLPADFLTAAKSELVAHLATGAEKLASIAPRLGMLGRAGATGLTQGAFQGAQNAINPDEQSQPDSALMGAFGSILHGAGELGANAVNAAYPYMPGVINKIRNLSGNNWETPKLDEVTQYLKNRGVDLDSANEMVKNLVNSDRSALEVANPATMNAAQKIGATTEGNNILSKEAQDITGNQGNDVANMINNLSKDKNTYIQGKQAIKQEYEPQINAAYEAAKNSREPYNLSQLSLKEQAAASNAWDTLKRVMSSPQIGKNITSKLKYRMEASTGEDLSNYDVVKNLTPENVDEYKKVIDKQIKSIIDKSDIGSSDLNDLEALQNHKNMILDLADKSIPGYSDARALSQESFEKQQALDLGNKLFTEKSKVYVPETGSIHFMSPEVFNLRLQNMSAPEKDLVRSSALDTLAKRVGSSPRVSNKAEIFKNDDERSMFSSLFGEQATQNLERNLGKSSQAYKNAIKIPNYINENADNVDAYQNAKNADLLKSIGGYKPYYMLKHYLNLKDTLTPQNIKPIANMFTSSGKQEAVQNFKNLADYYKKLSRSAPNYNAQNAGFNASPGFIGAVRSTLGGQ